jgi:hypothetical protein
MKRCKFVTNRFVGHLIFASWRIYNHRRGTVGRGGGGFGETKYVYFIQSHQHNGFHYTYCTIISNTGTVFLKNGLYSCHMESGHFKATYTEIEFAKTFTSLLFTVVDFFQVLDFYVP